MGGSGGLAAAAADVHRTRRGGGGGGGVGGGGREGVFHFGFKSRQRGADERPDANQVAGRARTRDGSRGSGSVGAGVDVKREHGAAALPHPPRARP